jgi:hypothetical protein
MYQCGQRVSWDAAIVVSQTGGRYHTLHRNGCQPWIFRLAFGVDNLVNIRLYITIAD